MTRSEVHYSPRYNGPRQLRSLFIHANMSRQVLSVQHEVQAWLLVYTRQGLILGVSLALLRLSQVPLSG